MRMLCAAFISLGAVACAADTLCVDIKALANPQTSRPLKLPAALSGETGTCRTSLAMSGATDVHCSWSFGYRAQAAEIVFRGLLDAVTACLGPDAVMTTDTSVNHPDTYTLRTFSLDGQEISLSLKDKGALQQSLVFVRVQVR